MQHVRFTPTRVVAAAAACALVALGAAGLSHARARAQQGLPSAAASAQTRGKAVYDTHCVECHGSSGKGDGPAATTLMPRPRDFTSGRYKIRTTETGSLPTDDDLIRSVKLGLPGSAMPGWDTLLTDADIAAVVQHIKSLSPRFAAEQPEPIALTEPVAPTTDSITRGAAVYTTLQCGKCHGTDGRGAGATATRFDDDWGDPMRASDLAEPWTFRGGATPADVFMRFRAGISGTPMPSYKGTATDAGMWDLANFVASLRRKPVWEMNAEEVAAFYEEENAAALADPVRRGEYLTEILSCPVCHSPVDEERRAIPGMRMAGGLRMVLAPYGTYPTGNLTSDRETGLGNWTDDEIKRAITKGILRDGTRLLPFPMDWASFSTMKASDLNAIVAYLRTIPPIRNRVPRPTRTALPLFLWGKFRMMVLGHDIPSYFYAGNAGVVGTASGGR